MKYFILEEDVEELLILVMFSFYVCGVEEDLFLCFTSCICMLGEDLCGDLKKREKGEEYGKPRNSLISYFACLGFCI